MTSNSEAAEYHRRVTIPYLLEQAKQTLTNDSTPSNSQPPSASASKLLHTQASTVRNGPIYEHRPILDQPSTKQTTTSSQEPISKKNLIKIMKGGGGILKRTMNDKNRQTM